MPRDWIIPPRTAPETERLGYIRESIQEGDNFLKSQRGYKDHKIALDILSGEESEKIPSSLSDIYINRLKRQVREIVAVESNIRPEWNYKVGDRNYIREEDIVNKCWESWWTGTFADQDVKKAIQWAVSLGTGWAYPTWDNNFWAPGRGDIRLNIFGPKDVKPVQLPRDMDIQKAYIVWVIIETPINVARAMYPRFQGRIKPDRDEPSMLRRGMTRLSRFMSPVLQLSEREKEDVPVGYPTVDICHGYVLDTSINTSGHMIPMGEPGSAWYYEVPYLGQEIPTNIRDQQGRVLTRKSDFEDCRMYPYRRLIECCSSCIFYDNTSPRWDGRVPLAKFSTDDWPWEFLGFSAVKDGAPLQKGMNEVARNIQDRLNAGLRPPMGYDQNAVDQALMDVFDPRQPGVKVKMDFTMSQDPIRTLMGENAYRIPPEALKMLMEFYPQQMDYLLALPDISAMARAAQIPAGESVERLLEASGPIVTDISRSIERSLGQLGQLWLPMFFTHYTARRRFDIRGKDGLSKEDFTYEPGSICPSHLPGEDQSKASPTPIGERLRQFYKLFNFNVVPHTAHQITQTQRQLKILQLWRSGYPIDPWTIGKEFDIPFGEAPANALTIHDKWKAWMEESTKFTAATQAQAQLIASMILSQAGMGGPPAPGGGQPTNGSEQPPAGMPHRNEGRQPSAQVAPHMETRDGGTRPIISESR